MATTITATEARDGLLFPALDALALNQQQGRMLIDPSPEVDSLVEEIASLRVYGVPGDRLRCLLGYCQRVIDLNHQEADHERTVTETADRLADRAHRARTGRQPHTGLTVKQAAGLLRPALRTILAHHDGRPATHQLGLFRAYLAAFDVIVRMSAPSLLGSGMQVALGARQYRLLGDLVAEHDEHTREGSK